MEKHKVNVDLEKLQGFRAGAREQGRQVVNLGFAVVFLVLVLIYAATTQADSPTGIFVIAAAVIGAIWL